MSVANQPGGALPRPRIPNVMGIANLYFGAILILLSLTMAGYLAILPLTSKAMNEIQKQADDAVKAKRGADLKTVDDQEKAARTAIRKRELAARRKEIEARATKAIPIAFDSIGNASLNATIMVYSWFDMTTALVLDLLLLAAGIGLVRRELWGLRLGLWTAAAKIARLVLAYGFVIVAIIPPFAQAIGRMAVEMISQQPGMMGPGGKRGAPPGFDPAFMTKLYSIFYTVSFVALILLGSIYPAISAWFLSRPGARSACNEPGSRFKALSGMRVLGTLNILFASSLLFFGLCFSAYVAVLPLVARGINRLQDQAEAQQAKAAKDELKTLDKEEKAAKTKEEKEAVQIQRKAIETRPKQAVVAKVDFSTIFATSPKITAFYSVELASGVLLNVAMLVAGIALVRQKRWGIGLGIGTAVAKIARLVLVYGYFSVVLSTLMAQQSGATGAKMLAFQQQAFGRAAGLELDPSPLVRVNLLSYRVLPIAIIVLGSIYPAISIWLLARAATPATEQEQRPPGGEWNGT